MSAEIVLVYTPSVHSPEEAVSPWRDLANHALPAENPLTGDRSFFEPKSIQELIRSQGVSPVEDVSVFAGGIPDDEDVDAMLEEIYRSRKP